MGLLPPRVRKGYSSFRVRPRILKDSDKRLLEKTKRILSSLGSYLKMELSNVNHKMKIDAVSRARRFQLEARQRAAMKIRSLNKIKGLEEIKGMAKDLGGIKGMIRAKERKTVGWDSARKLQTLAREREKKLKDLARERARKLIKERRASLLLRKSRQLHGIWSLTR